MVETMATFSSFSHLLDPRLLRALADMKFSHSTPIQAQAIPLALGEARDIVARARTGSGKTAAYCLPVVQKILAGATTGTRALILVPTRELAEQVTRYLVALCKYCEGVVVVNAANTASASAPDIVVATPARALALFQSKVLQTPHLESLVIDEADLVLSYGHDEDIRQIFNGSYLPKVYQTFLMSATMTEDVEVLKGMIGLRNPAILNLEDTPDSLSNLTQYAVRCSSEEDKFLLTYVILKLKLVRGKCIIFVNADDKSKDGASVDRCYRLKLFLEQFSIKCCVLNSELPVNSRYHTVQEFNKGVYDYIIASDESGGREEDSDDDHDKGEDEEMEEFTSTQREDPSTIPANSGSSSGSGSRKRKRADPDPLPPSQKRKSKSNTTKNNAKSEYGVTRGIDFIDVACVLNFDLPSSARAYTHRIGRTARAGRTGMALSFVGTNDEKIFAKIEKAQQLATTSKILPYQFDTKQIEAFRYRMEDALRSVTRSVVREARVQALRGEILRSGRLKAHFEDNPMDLEYLRHDKPLHPTRVQPHMKYVPRYLLPKGASAAIPASVNAGSGSTDAGVDAGARAEAGGFVPFRKTASMRGAGRGGRGGRGRGGGKGGAGGRGGRGGGKKKGDPLKKFGK
ncbi:DEAD-domain-containing protein [Gymnopus androsaceus JB14]|uniref:RNA helicase n=1 Tax=Gymnopus androsaceus JB14 TaxID=1447944 RepID=A0A6A4IBW3_9AGAR|nr:DEAD-domain-containing protein [Gymnopus androsaceus JB14]